MADTSIRIKHDVYEVEVNDKGETIVIDLMDVEFPLKFQKAHEQIQRLQKEMEKTKELMLKKSDTRDGLLSKNEKEALLMMRDKYKEMRGVLDELLGEGASEKIFGKRNYWTMFNDFFEAFAPIMEKAGLSLENSLNAIKEKYGATDEKAL